MTLLNFSYQFHFHIILSSSEMKTLACFNFMPLLRLSRETDSHIAFFVVGLVCFAYCLIYMVTIFTAREKHQHHCCWNWNGKSSHGACSRTSFGSPGVDCPRDCQMLLRWLPEPEHPISWEIQVLRRATGPGPAGSSAPSLIQFL